MCRKWRRLGLSVAQPELPVAITFVKAVDADVQLAQNVDPLTSLPVSLGEKDGEGIWGNATVLGAGSRLGSLCGGG